MADATVHGLIISAEITSKPDFRPFIYNIVLQKVKEISTNKNDKKTTQYELTEDKANFKLYDKSPDKTLLSTLTKIANKEQIVEISFDLKSFNETDKNGNETFKPYNQVTNITNLQKQITNKKKAPQFTIQFDENKAKQYVEDLTKENLRNKTQTETPVENKYGNPFERVLNK